MLTAYNVSQIVNLLFLLCDELKNISPLRMALFHNCPKLSGYHLQGKYMMTETQKERLNSLTSRILERKITQLEYEEYQDLSALFRAELMRKSMTSEKL